jgi:hypothetical protein
MANPENVSKLPPPLPTEITIKGTPDVRLTANEMRRLKADTGKTLTDLMGEDADEADRMQTMVWLELRRQDFDVHWTDVGDVALEFVPEPPDPMSGGLPNSSQHSADSGE